MKIFQRFGGHLQRIARVGLALGLATAVLSSAATIEAGSASADTGWAGASFCSNFGSTYQQASYAGVAVCSNPNFHGNVYYGNVIFEYGNAHYSSWQCVEYADRYFYAVTGKSITSMDGKGWVSAAHAKYPQYAASPATSTFDNSIQPGDPISMWGGSGSDPDGHIAIVTAVNVSGGNGTITLIGENQAAPTTTINVSGGQMTRGSKSSPYYYYTAFQWLELYPPAPQTIPAMPTSPRVASTSASAATLAWSEPASNQTGFKTQYSSNGGKTWTAGPSTDANTNSVTIGGLSASTTYTFQVGATNSIGTRWSAYVTGRTMAPPPLPAQPTNPRVTSTSTSTAALAWTDVSNNEDGFRTQYSADGGRSWTSGPSVGANATSITIGGLSASTGYTFQVGAYNVSGTHWSAYTTARTQNPPPSVSQYANSIVKQNNGSSTSWWVTSDLKRLWIPDGNTYNQLMARYHPTVNYLSADALNQLPDQTNQWAASGASWGANREMRQGMSVTSPNGIYTLVMQGDGNLVLYNNASRALWASNTVGRGQFVIFQGDGNLVVYTANGQAVWNSGTGGRGATSFNVQDDGNLVEYGNNGAVWASNTSQARSVKLQWGAVSGHTGPGDNYAAGPTHPQGSSITILCYVNGAIPANRNPAAGNDAAWYNDSMWDRATDGYYYSDAWLATGSDNAVVPHC